MGKQRQVKTVVGALGALVLFAEFLFSVPLKDSYTDTPTGHPSETTETSQSPQTAIPGFVVTSDDNTDGSPWSVTSEAADVYPSGPRVASTTPRPLAKKDFATINNTLYPLRTYRTLLTPNDPLADQWWVEQASLATAWDTPSGGNEVVLAVIDTGFGLNHEDLAGRWYENPGESGAATGEGSSLLNCTDRGLPLDYSCNLVDDDVDGVVDNESGPAPYENPSRLNCTAQGLSLQKSCNRLDDDANGYVDDWRGWDAINQDNSVQAGELSPTGGSTTHGTMVAGVAAATGNNGLGIAGVNWEAKVMPIQAIDDDGYGDTRSVGQAIFYAAQNGADVINISLGTDYHDPYVSQAVEAATAAGITIVASSGNDGCECVVYPARYPEVVAVGALNTDGTQASFSSWGSSVDIAAPGVNMTLPSWSSTNQTSRYVSGAAGTSFSSPLIAGAIARIKSYRPEATPLHLVAALHETADRRHNAPVQLPTTRYGFGLVDVAALQSRMLTPKHTAVSYELSPVAAGNRTGTAYETTADYRVHDCMQARTALPLYELKKTADTFYSISEVEARRAVQSGYTNARFAYVCLGQPHDTVEVVRPINIYREFRSLSSKF